MKEFASEQVFAFTTWPERRFTAVEYFNWANERTYLPYLTVCLYMVFVFVGQEFMRHRTAYLLKRPLIAWNFGLAVFSVLTAWRVGTFVLHEYRTGDGLHDVVCDVWLDNVAAFWNVAFAGSKFLELGDTFFLIARKRPVIFLHWYHHVTVLIFTWITTTAAAPLGKIFMLVNAVVHSVMYSYYACAALGIRFPKAVAMCITSMQLIQMVIGILFLSASVVYSYLDSECKAPAVPLAMGFLIYGSYFALFLKFFCDSYFARGNKQKGT